MAQIVILDDIDNKKVTVENDKVEDETYLTNCFEPTYGSFVKSFYCDKSTVFFGTEAAYGQVLNVVLVIYTKENNKDHQTEGIFVTVYIYDFGDFVEVLFVY